MCYLIQYVGTYVVEMMIILQHLLKLSTKYKASDHLLLVPKKRRRPEKIQRGEAPGSAAGVCH